MANIAARGFYLVLDKIKNELLTNDSVNTVTTGDLFDIDLNKQNMFPLTHIIINNVGMQEQVLNFQLSILAMDIVDTSCLLYTSPSPRDRTRSRMPSSA